MITACDSRHQRLRQRAQLGQIAGADLDRVAALAKLDVDGGHAGSYESSGTVASRDHSIQWTSLAARGAIEDAQALVES